MEKKKVALLVIGCSALAAVISVCATLGLSAIKDKKSESSSTVPELADTVTLDTEYEQAEVVNEDTGEVKTYTTGGYATIETESGETINCTVANDMYLISDDYLSILAQGFGVSQAVVAPNTVITGNMPSVTQSMSSINAAPFSDIMGMYSQIFGEDYVGSDETVVWSPAYTYLKTGEFPETLPDDYKCEEYKTFTYENIKWTCYNVSFTNDYTTYYDEEGNAIPEEEIVPNVISTQHLACYSDTEDPVEILVYEEKNDVGTELEMLYEFLGME